jgi:hypothetical protein
MPSEFDAFCADGFDEALGVTGTIAIQWNGKTLQASWDRLQAELELEEGGRVEKVTATALLALGEFLGSAIPVAQQRIKVPSEGGREYRIVRVDHDAIAVSLLLGGLHG